MKVVTINYADGCYYVYPFIEDSFYGTVIHNVEIEELKHYGSPGVKISFTIGKEYKEMSISSDRLIICKIFEKNT